MAIFIEDSDDTEEQDELGATHSESASSPDIPPTPRLLREMLVSAMPRGSNAAGGWDTVGGLLYDQRINTTLTTVANWILVFANEMIKRDPNVDPGLLGFLMALSEDVRDQVEWSTDYGPPAPVAPIDEKN